MTDYNFGDIVLVPFPFTDQTDFKKRPALIVSSEQYNQKRLDIIIMAITSRTHAPANFGDVRLEGWREAGLIKPSTIKPVFATIEQSLVLKRLGYLGEKDLSVLQKNLKMILGL
ncbi:MAG: type II toxin-antitoxin system PemK/MazF family toxin [Deltaproteobacteria bacterium]|nr:type II toxin-antitoxin system PemK/MazF family toxin [Deltaproteobacteria bacterium]